MIALAAAAGFSQQQTGGAVQPVQAAPVTTSGTAVQLPPAVNQALPPVTTAEQENARLAALAEADQLKPGDYVIGPADILDINIFEVPDLSREVEVNETGYISLPLIPAKIKVAGLTAFQLQDKLSELLEVNGLVSSPQVTVTVKEQHSEPITVVGAVNRPSVIQAVRQENLLEVLSDAGGIAPDAAGFVIVSRNGVDFTPADANTANGGGVEPIAPKTYTINLDDLLDTGDMRFNIPLQGGDVVTVPHAGIIYVMGAVNRPGGYVLTNDHQQVTATKIVTLAGGISSTGKGNQAVIVRTNKDTGQREQIPLKLSEVMKLRTQDIALLPNDILYVPDSTGKRALYKTGNAIFGIGTGVALFRLSAGM